MLFCPILVDKIPDFARYGPLPNSKESLTIDLSSARSSVLLERPESVIVPQTHKALIGLFSFACLASTACMAQQAVPETAETSCAEDRLNVSRTIEVSPGQPSVSEQLADGEVILTFDDGPSGSRTRGVLDALEAECVRAAFFLRGDEARWSAKLVREIVSRGHTLGGHGWAHSDLTKLSPAAAQADITRGLNGINRAFRKADHPPEISLFRFPFVARNEALTAMLADMGLVDIGVDVDGADWTGNSAEEIVDLVMEKLEARGRRGIVLLHDPFANSVEATEGLLARLKAENYAIVEIVPAPVR